MSLRNFIIKSLHLSDGQYEHYKLDLAIYYYIRRLYRMFSCSAAKKNVSYMPHNEAYGHEYWLKTYAHWDKPIYGEIEHGIYLGKMVFGGSFHISYQLKTILTFGRQREEILKSKLKDFDVYMIGPRIAYAETDQAYKAKLAGARNGCKRVATLFPSHSTDEDTVSFSVQEFIDLSKKIANDNGIDKIRVCMRKVDIRRNNGYDEFIKQGFDVVSADINQNYVYGMTRFLPRLRAILETTDLVISNDLGTHIVYGLYLGVPQIIASQNIQLVKVNRVAQSDISPEVIEFFRIQNEEKAMFAKAFDPKHGMMITNEQYNLCNYYFGFDQVKPPKELHAIFEAIYDKFKHS